MGLISMLLGQRTGRPEERGGDGAQPASGAIGTHTTFIISFTLLCGCGLWHPKTITGIKARITLANIIIMQMFGTCEDHQMRHRDIHEASKHCWKNGAETGSMQGCREPSVRLKAQRPQSTVKQRARRRGPPVSNTFQSHFRKIWKLSTI